MAFLCGIMVGVAMTLVFNKPYSISWGDHVRHKISGQTFVVIDDYDDDIYTINSQCLEFICSDIKEDE